MGEGELYNKQVMLMTLEPLITLPFGDPCLSAKYFGFINVSVVDEFKLGFETLKASTYIILF